MLYSITWSKEAANDYAANIDYLLEEWSVKDAQEFIDKSGHIIKIIAVLPKAFPAADYKNVRKAVVSKQITLLYRIDKKGIILLRFWNNSRNPEKLRNH